MINLHLLKSKELFNIEAVTIEPFKHTKNENIIDNEKIELYGI